MNFRINNDDSDITRLSNQLRDWEQAGKDLPAEKRTLLNLCAHMLESLRSQMIATAEELEKALALKTGYSDSDSRQVEVARQKKAAIEEQIMFLRQIVNQRTLLKGAKQELKVPTEVI